MKWLDVVKKYGLLLILCLFCACEIRKIGEQHVAKAPGGGSIKSGIEKIDSIVQATSMLEKATPQTLVIFDIDDTLIVPAEKMFYPLFKDIDDFDELDVAFVKQIGKTLEKLAASKDDRIIFSKTKFVPVEQKTVEFIKMLQNRNVKVIALTNGGPGKFIGIEIMKKWRFAHLNQLGLNFSNSFKVQEVVLESLPPLFGFNPTFYQGVLYASGNPKGSVLSAFLNKLGWKPDQVIFFDDLMKQCKSVLSEMEKLNISCQCFLYRAAYRKKIKLNQKLIKKQFDYWIEHKEILPENEVAEIR